MNTSFFELGYWFDPTPGFLAPGAMKIFSLFLVALFALAFIAYLRTKRKRDVYYKGWSKIFNFALSNLAIGLVLLFFFYENLPYLSIRFTVIVWLGIMIYWMVTIIKVFKKVPEAKQKRQEEQEYKKYIP